MSNREVRSFSISEMAEYLREQLPSTAASVNIAANSEANRISWRIFLELTESDLQELIPCLGDRKEVKTSVVGML